MVFVNQILGVILKETLILVQNYIQHYIEIGKIYALIFHVRILTSFGAGDLGTEVDFLYSVMWVTKVTF